MSWHYLRVQEEESLQDICSGGEQLPPLKSKITHAEFYCNGKLMDSYLDSLSGTTYEHSMESLGEEKSMSSQAVFHARTLVPQEKAQDLMESDQDFGEKWQGSFAKYNPDTHSLRTHQCSLFEDSTEYCVTLPKWGLMLDGELWEQQTLAHLIKGTESGLSPTPPPPDNWPTPIASGGGGGTNINNPRGIHQGNPLASAVKLSLGKWPTPTAHMAKETNAPSEALRNEPSLTSRVGGQLNPNWVEWLMGWPIGFTDLKPLVMDKFQKWQQQHGKYSVKESND
jgi:hypothetical protein